MVNIVDIIFFYSKSSSSCLNIIKFIESYNIPVKGISVDSKDIRQKIKNHNNFQIKGVPTIIVVYSDGNGGLYEGDKVYAWFSQLVSSQNNKVPSHAIENTYISNENIPDEPLEDYPNYENEDEYEIVSEAPKNIKDQKSSDIKNLAMQMEEERKRTLGFTE